jgi:hypothetical protein
MTQLPDAWSGQFSAAGGIGDATAVALTYFYLGAIEKAYAVANEEYGLALARYLVHVQQIREQAQKTVAAAYERLVQQQQPVESPQPSPMRDKAEFDHRITDGNFVSHLVQDPSNPPSTAMLFGFPGRAANESCARFYMDPMLSAHVDIPKEKILGVADLPRSHSPLGGCYVWVQKDPELMAMIQDSLNRAISAGQELWNRSGAPGGFLMTAPDQFANVTAAEPTGQTTDASDDEEDVPLPPGWPLAAS